MKYNKNIINSHTVYKLLFKVSNMSTRDKLFGHNFSLYCRDLEQDLAHKAAAWLTVQTKLKQFLKVDLQVNCVLTVFENFIRKHSWQIQFYQNYSFTNS